MKKISSLTLMLLLLFIACNNNEDEIIETQNRSLNESKFTAKDFAFVGIEHNQGLERTLQFLTDNKERISKLPVSERIPELQNFLVGDVDPENKYDDRSDELSESQIEQIFSSIKYEDDTNLSYRVSYISDTANEYLERLQFIVESRDNPSIDKVLANISILEEEIESSRYSFTDKELVILFSATQTARYTCQYWFDNIGKWSSISNIPQSRCPGQDASGCYNDVVGSIASADVAGAVGGAAVAFVANIVPGAGQITYGGAIVTGAVGNSVQAAVSSFIDWLFG
jgi:hypothetical protein